MMLQLHSTTCSQSLTRPHIDPPNCFHHLPDGCSFPQSKLAPDDAIAGLGIFIVFVINAALCIAGTYIVVWDRFNTKVKGISNKKDSWLCVAANGIGDVQLFAGIAVSLSTYILVQNGIITAYHYNLACLLSVSATFTALTTVFAWPKLSKHITATCTRLVALFLAIILLGLLLVPVSAAGTVYPGSAPVGMSGPDSALVLPASCILKHQIPKDCRYSTDRSPWQPVSGAWVLMPLGLIFLAGLYTKVPEFIQLFEKDGKSRTNGKKRNVSEMILQLSAITIASLWSMVALWQYYMLRQYMNGSTWLESQAEEVVTSFSQLLPIIQIFSTLLLLACTCDKWIASVRQKKQDKLDRNAKPEETTSDA